MKRAYLRLVQRLGVPERNLRIGFRGYAPGQRVQSDLIMKTALGQAWRCEDRESANGSMTLKIVSTGPVDSAGSSLPAGLRDGFTYGSYSVML
jgi:hypothetical protein